MKNRSTPPGLRLLGAAVALACLSAFPASGQEESGEAAQPTAEELAQYRDPRVPDTVPNISGTWFLGPYSPLATPVDGSETPFLPWSREVFEGRVAAQEAGAPIFDASAACMPPGFPRIMLWPYPLEIVQTPETTVIVFESDQLFRVIHMNAEHPDDLEPSHMGHSVGHWEGDTLVVDTVGMLAHSQLDATGTPHSEELHVVEHIRKDGPELLEIIVTVDDPEAFAEPWDFRIEYDWSPDIRLLEYVCTENNRNEPDAEGVLRNY